jgi:hypothetical protein
MGTIKQQSFKQQHYNNERGPPLIISDGNVGESPRMGLALVHKSGGLSSIKILDERKSASSVERRVVGQQQNPFHPI